MEIDKLKDYDIPPEILDRWKQLDFKMLLPLQEASVTKHDLFSQKNLLTLGPPSSGRSFIGELAAIHGICNDDPIISTCDHWRFDQDIVQAEFIIARPTEVRRGIQYQGIFTYREQNSSKTGTETILDKATANADDMLFAAVKKMLTNNENVLLFLRSRDDAVGLFNLDYQK